MKTEDLEKRRAYNRASYRKFESKRRAKSLEYYYKHRSEIRAKQLFRTFGISDREYQVQLAHQGGVCAICKTPPGETRKLAVDHNHETGKIRELLCIKCNSALGLFQESAGLLEAAKQYLVKHEQNG